MKRGYSIVDTTSLPSANSLDHHAQLLNMSAMIKQFSEQMEFLKSNIEIQQHHPSGRGVELVQERTDIALQNTLKSTAEPLPLQGPDGTIQWQNELYLPNSSSSDSQFIQLSTPQPLWVRGMEESSHNELIGSQSRTSSENSNHTTESSTSNGSVQLPNKRKKIPTSHRHFRYQPLTLTLNEFKLRLAARLSEDVLETELMVKFPSLYAFREEYIIPLTRKFPCTKTLDLSCLVGDDDMFRKGFESSYESIFVKGCHVPRIPRAAGKTAIPETKQRIMYRHLIKDLWEILGSLFYYAYLFRYQLFNY
jgi:hypothetical protein